MIAIRFIEPLDGNAAALGVNALSMPAARAAIRAAVDTGRPAATAGFRLTQQATSDRQMGVVIYQAIYDARGRRDRAERARRVARRRLRHAGAWTRSSRPLLGEVPAYLELCLVDADHLAPRRRLAGRAGCEAARRRPDARAAARLRRPAVGPARRRAGARPCPRRSDRNAWLFSVVGLLSAAMLGALLLIVTGRTRRIESAVRERTAALRAEVARAPARRGGAARSEQRFRNILDNVPIGVIYTDLPAA